MALEFFKSFTVIISYYKILRMEVDKSAICALYYFCCILSLRFFNGILSVEQKVAEFLKNSGQNSAHKSNRPLCSLEWQWALLHTLQVFHMSLVLHKTFQRVSQAGINNFSLKIMRRILFSDIEFWFDSNKFIFKLDLKKNYHK